MSEDKRRSAFWKPVDRETERKLKREKGEEMVVSFTSPSSISCVSNTGFTKNVGPNWSTDWVQIRPELMDK